MEGGRGRWGQVGLGVARWWQVGEVVPGGSWRGLVGAGGARLGRWGKVSG